MKKTAKTKNQPQKSEKFIPKRISESEQKLVEQLIVQLQQLYESENAQDEIIGDVSLKLQDLIVDFNNIPIDDLKQAIGSSKLELIEEGTTIFKIGDKAVQFYVLLQGMCSVQILTPSNNIQQTDKFNLTEVKRLEQFSTFGELGLIHKNGLRSSTVVAKTDCVLISIPKEIYNQNIKKDVMQELDVLWQKLKKISYLQHWNERDIANLIYKLSTKKFNFNQTVYQRGESSNSGIFFVVKGEFEVRRQLEVDVLTEKERQAVNSIRPDLAGQKKSISVQIGVVSSGNTFGEDEVVLNKERVNNVVCISEGAEAYIITKSEFEKKILWDEKTKKCLNTLIKTRQDWASQKIEEYMKTLERSKPMMISRKLSSDSLYVVEQESHFQNFDNSPLSTLSRGSLHSRGKIINEIKQRRQSQFSENTNKNNNIQQTNDLQFKRSSFKQNLDEPFMSQQETIALAILKDQNKMMGTEQDADDITIKNKNNNNTLQIRKEYNFNDQMNQLLVENTVRTQQFEAISNKVEDANKQSNQTASYLANLVTVKHNNLPELDEDYKKQKGENLTSYIERIRKISYMKRVKEDKKQILSQELNSMFKKYCNGENVQINVNSNLQSQSNQNQFMDFNQVRQAYKDQKLEELQQKQQKKQQTVSDKSPKSPSIQLDQFSNFKDEKTRQNSKFQVTQNDDKIVQIDELPPLEVRPGQQKLILKDNQDESHSLAMAFHIKRQSFKEDQFQKDISDLILENNDKPINEKNKNQKLKLNISNSPRMLKNFLKQEKSQKEQKQNETKNSQIQPSLLSTRSEKQYNFTSQADSNEEIQNNSPNYNIIEEDKNTSKQSSLVLSQSQIFSTPQHVPIKHHIKRNSLDIMIQQKLTPQKQQQQQNDQYFSYKQPSLQQQSQQQQPQKPNPQLSLLKYMRIDPSSVIQTTTAFLSHRPLVKQSKQKKYSQHDDGDTEIDQEYFNITKNNHVQSESNSPCLKPINNFRKSSINFNRGFESQTLQTVSNVSRSSFSHLYNSQIMKTQQDTSDTCLDTQKNFFKPSKYFTKSQGLTKQIFDKIQPNNFKNKINTDIRPRVNSYNQQEIQQQNLQLVNQYQHDIGKQENQKIKYLNRKSKTKSSLIGNGAINPQDLEKGLLIARNLHIN